MRHALLTGALIAALAVLAWLAAGGGDVLARWAAEGTARFQDRLAQALRALHAGEPGALLALLGIAFLYGLLHAAGPGHGKVLMAGYGAARRVPVARLAGLALAASLAQAAVAVVLVHGGLWIAGWTRDRLTAIEADVLAPLSLAMIAGLGFWLVWRGLRGLRRHLRPPPDPACAHPAPAFALALPQGSVSALALAPAAAPSAVCPDCGHRHGPTAAEAAAVRSPREALALVAGIAVRPCTGALILLLLTARLDLHLAGIAGAFAMGLGTAAVTAGVAAAAALAREGALAQADRHGWIAQAAPILEILAGAAVTVLALRALGGTM